MRQVFTVTHAERAALRVFGLRELPKTEEELKKVFRRLVKKTHPDTFGPNRQCVSEKPIKRVYRAMEVLTEAIKERDKPKVFVRFGSGDVRQANVIDNHLYNNNPFSNTSAERCKYVTTIKWFTGLTVKVGSSGYRKVPEPMDFILKGVFVRCV